MDYCLCCGKPLNEKSENGWHTKCIKKFFEASHIPSFDLSEYNLTSIVNSNIEEKKTITGVQRKISFTLQRKSNKKLTIKDDSIGYILKPNTFEFPYIAESEHLVMLMANEAKIATALHGLIQYEGKNFIYICKRMDRLNGNKIHMEDFCQLSNRPEEYKYSSSCEKCLKIVDAFSSFADLDKVNLFERIVFSFITCNSDMHLKNYSLIEEQNSAYLAPSYDLLPVNLLMEKDEEESALTINGKKKNLKRKDFLSLAEVSHINSKVAENIIEKHIKLKDTYLKLISESLLPIDAKEKYSKMVCKRISALSKSSFK